MPTRTFSTFKEANEFASLAAQYFSHDLLVRPKQRGWTVTLDDVASQSAFLELDAISLRVLREWKADSDKWGGGVDDCVGDYDPHFGDYDPHYDEEKEKELDLISRLEEEWEEEEYERAENAAFHEAIDAERRYWQDTVAADVWLKWP